MYDTHTICLKPIKGQVYIKIKMSIRKTVFLIFKRRSKFRLNQNTMAWGDLVPPQVKNKESAEYLPPLP